MTGVASRLTAAIDRGLAGRGGHGPASVRSGGRTGVRPSGEPGRRPALRRPVHQRAPFVDVLLGEQGVDIDSVIGVTEPCVAVGVDQLLHLEKSVGTLGRGGVDPGVRPRLQ